MNRHLPPRTESYKVTRNACKLCTPLGASLAFKGIRGAVSILHGSQGCSTYIRRYMISHFREPIDIASTNFSESTSIYGGAENLKTALKNISLQYQPELIGIATTCLSETIGDNVPMILNKFRKELNSAVFPPVVHVSTASYRGTHVDGFHRTVEAIAEQIAEKSDDAPLEAFINVMPGMVSPADLRLLKEVFEDFGLKYVLLPDYSETLDGQPWTEYERIPAGGTPLQSIRSMGNARASIEFGEIGVNRHSAGKVLEDKYAVPRTIFRIPLGVTENDAFFKLLGKIAGQAIPKKYLDQRGRLVDAYLDGHKYVFEKKAVVLGEEDFVVAVAAFLHEIGMIPVLCASGGNSTLLKEKIADIIPDYEKRNIAICSDVDFVEIEEKAKLLKPDLIIGNSKSYQMASSLNVPLIRMGFPIHDRFGGARVKHVGYEGTLELFDKLVNALLETTQTDSGRGYSYM